MTYFYFLLTGKRFQFEARECKHLQQQQQIAAGDRPAGLPVQVLVRVRLAKHSARAHLPPQVVLFHADYIGNKKRKVFSSFLGSSLFSVVFFCAVFCTVFQFLVLCIQFRIDWIFCRENSQVVGSTYYLSSISSYWDAHSDILIIKHCKETMEIFTLTTQT